MTHKTMSTLISLYDDEKREMPQNYFRTTFLTDFDHRARDELRLLRLLSQSRGPGLVRLLLFLLRQSDDCGQFQSAGALRRQSTRWNQVPRQSGGNASSRGRRSDQVVQNRQGPSFFARNILSLAHFRTLQEVAFKKQWEGAAKMFTLLRQHADMIVEAEEAKAALVAEDKGKENVEASLVEGEVLSRGGLGDDGRPDTVG